MASRNRQRPSGVVVDTEDRDSRDFGAMVVGAKASKKLGAIQGHRDFDNKVQVFHWRAGCDSSQRQTAQQGAGHPIRCHPAQASAKRKAFMKGEAWQAVGCPKGGLSVGTLARSEPLDNPVRFHLSPDNHYDAVHVPRYLGTSAAMARPVTVGRRQNLSRQRARGRRCGSRRQDCHCSALWAV